MNYELIGYSAAFLTTASYIPQAVKTIRDKDTKSLSLAMYIVVTLGLFLWLVYGILTGSNPLIASNTVSLLLAVIILIMKIKHG